MSGQGDTHDTVLGGRVQLVQPRQGFRAGTDSLLLAACLPDIGDGDALDVGAGSGGALLPAAWRLANTRFVGVERDPAAASRLQAGATLNAAEARLAVETADITDWARGHENRFDLVFSNPPFFDATKTTGPGTGKEAAYLESVPLDAWLKAMVFAAKPRAPIVILHRAAKLAELLSLMDKWAGELTVLPIRPRAGEAAGRVLVKARKGLKRGDTRLLSGLDLFEGDTPSPRVRAVEAGSALEWR